MEKKNNSLITSITPHLISGKNKHTTPTTAAIKHGNHPYNVNTGVSCKSGSDIDKVILYSWPPSFPVTSWEGFTNWSAMYKASGAYPIDLLWGILEGGKDWLEWGIVITLVINLMAFCCATAPINYKTITTCFWYFSFFIQFWVVNSSIIIYGLACLRDYPSLHKIFL